MNIKIYENIVDSIIELERCVMEQELNRIHEYVFELYFHTLSLDKQNHTDRLIITDINKIRSSSNSLDVNYKQFKHNINKLHYDLKNITINDID